MAFANVLNGTGVYVIWDSQARAKPSYIGMGDLLTRLSSHDDAFAYPVGGYIGLLGSTGRKTESNEAAIIEALLLEVANQTDRWPLHNRKRGDMSFVRRMFRCNGLVRVTVTGCDPFGPASSPRYLRTPKQIRFQIDSAGNDVLEYNWNSRKRLLR